MQRNAVDGARCSFSPDFLRLSTGSETFTDHTTDHHTVLMPDDTDPLFDPIDQFVENESEVRFDVEVPTGLLGWKPPHERIGGAEKVSNAEIPDDPDERKERMVQEMWRRYRKLLQKDGYRVLVDLKEKLELIEGNAESQVNDLSILSGGRQRLLKVLREWSNQEAGDTKMEDIVADYEASEDHPYKLEYSRGQRRRSMPGLQRSGSGRLYLSEEYYRRKPLFHHDRPRVRFSGSETVAEVIDTVESRIRSEKRRLDDARNLKRLIQFRRQLIERFLWTYEVAGRVVPDATVKRVPKFLQGKERGLSHVLRVLAMLPDFHPDGGPRERSWPTQADLKETIDDRFSASDTGTSAAAVVEGASRVVRGLFSSRYESFRPDFYELLIEHQGDFRRWANRMDVKMTPGDASPSAGNSPGSV